MRRRRATTEGCSAATQKRSVETTCRRRDRSRRYSAIETAATAPNTARNCASDRLRKYIGRSPLSDPAHPDQVSKNQAFERL
jgi:hypothetical protein